MALDFLKLSDEKLADEFYKPDPETYMPKRREKVAKFAEAAAQAAKEGKETFRRKAFVISNGVAQAHVRSGADNLTIDGKDTFHVPAERLAEFYEGVAKEARSGNLDEAIGTEPEFSSSHGASTPRERSQVTREMSPEHRKAISDAAKKRWAEKKAAEKKN